MGFCVYEHILPRPLAFLSGHLVLLSDQLLHDRLLQLVLQRVQVMLTTKRRILILAVAFLLLVVVGYRAAVHAYAALPLNMHPFVATVEHYTVTNGVETIHHVDHVGRTASGAQVNWGIPNGMSVEVRSIQLPAGWGAMVIDSIKAKSTAQRPDAATAIHRAQLMNTPADCVPVIPNTVVALKKVGEEVLFTQTAYLLEQTYTRQDGKQERATFWAFPRYACMFLQSQVEENDGEGNWTLTRGTKLTALAEVPPPASKFAIPVDFTEMKPSQQALKLLGPTPKLSGEQLQKIQQQSGDDKYTAWHK